MIETPYETRGERRTWIDIARAFVLLPLALVLLAWLAVREFA